ncbi:MAG: DUF4230 domain-containing protein [Labilithrix sp.]
MQDLARLAWPAAFVAVAAMGFGFVRTESPAPLAHEITVTPQTGPTVVRSLKELARLETAQIRVEKVIDLEDHQKHFHGLVEADDSLLFVAAGEVVLGVDLGKADVTFDEATKTARITLDEPEVFSTRFDEPHSYVHSRKTDTFAQRNEGLEAAARREATRSFAAAGREPRAQEMARTQAEKELRALARAWGSRDLEVSWRGPKGEVAAAP